MHVGFLQVPNAQFAGNAHQRQDIKNLVHGLVRDKFLVPFADAVIRAVENERIAAEKRFNRMGADARGVIVFAVLMFP